MTQEELKAEAYRISRENNCALAGMEEAILALCNRAIEAEREECARTLCQGCRIFGHPVRIEGSERLWHYEDGQASVIPCEAAAIRRAE